MKIKVVIIKRILPLFLLLFIFLSSCKGFKQYNDIITAPLGEGYAVVQFLDVGQADCTLICLPDGRNILIDAGNQADGKKIADYLIDLNIKTLNYVICTHPHEDHIGGMRDVLAYCNIENIIMPKIADKDVDGSTVYEGLLLMVKDLNKGIISAVSDRIIVKDSSLTIKCLSPCCASYDNMNNYSAVVMISYGKTDMLFTGDAEIAVENELIAKYGEDLDADILKVGHHGSSTASSEEFLELVTPEYAIISCGDNNQYNHPHDEVIARLNDSNCDIMRTDTMGSIVFYIDMSGIVSHKAVNDICLNGD